MQDRHDAQDPIRYLTSPSNAVNQVANLFGASNFNSQVYIPNLFDIPVGIWNATFHMDKHDLTNPIYSESLKNSAVSISSNPSTAPPK